VAIGRDKTRGVNESMSVDPRLPGEEVSLGSERVQPNKSSSRIFARRTLRLLLRPPIRPPRRDENASGAVFIDVLFGVVVAKALEISSVSHIAVAERMHLLLAIVVAVTAWLGYHNSRNRARYVIAFFNLPLLQFTIDIGFVYLYWLLVVSSNTASDVTESVLISCVFALSCSWDLTALAMRRSAAYPDMKIEDDKVRRRAVTRAFLAIFLLLMIMIILARPKGAWSVFLTAVLTVLVIAHRWIQNVAQHP
jgi:hypothetical protein